MAKQIKDISGSTCLFIPPGSFAFEMAKKPNSNKSKYQIIDFDFKLTKKRNSAIKLSLKRGMDNYINVKTF